MNLRTVSSANGLTSLLISLPPHARWVWTIILALFWALAAGAEVHYVDLKSSAPTSLFTTWATAATNIQDAIDAATDGDEIVVTNGVYQTGGRVVYGAMTNRVAVTKLVVVRSVNGPRFTFIQGAKDPVMTNGDAAVRCVFLANGAFLSGFTLTNGGTRASGAKTQEQCGGGVWCFSALATISNCVLSGNSANYYAGGAYRGFLVDCTVTGNWAGDSGGGADYSFLSNCVVSNNWATAAGGVSDATLVNCILSSNQANKAGGGAGWSTLDNCVLRYNSVTNASTGWGGGAASSVLRNCTVMGNYSAYEGGGLDSCEATNCTLVANSALQYGGGGHDATLDNCLLTSNTTGGYGGGVDNSDLYQCMLSSNSASEGGAASYAAMTHCVLRNNSATDNGGGAYYGSLLNCLVISNNAAAYGGGARRTALTNCVLFGNQAFKGGGAAYGTAVNCSIAGNFATNSGGGTISATAYNCIICFNSAPSSSNCSAGTLTYCCTQPYVSGLGNLTGDPRFVNLLAGDLRLQSNSPCIDVGTGEPLYEELDLEGHLRFSGIAPDLGATEFQFDDPFYAWRLCYALPTDGSADYANPDADGLNNWQEWIAGTDPTNALSTLRIISVTNSASGTTIQWTSVTNRTYRLESTTNLAASAFSIVATNLAGQAGTTACADTNSPGLPARYYRVGVVR